LLLLEALVQLSKATTMVAILVGVVLSYSQWALVVASVLALTLMIRIMKIRMTRMSRTEDLMEALVFLVNPCLVNPCLVKPCLVLVVPPAEEPAGQTIVRWLGDLQLQLMRPLGLTTTRVRQRSNHRKGESLVSQHEPRVGNPQGSFTNLIATREVVSEKFACAIECIMLS
jgi:hypothetical protein